MNLRQKAFWLYDRVINQEKVSVYLTDIEDYLSGNSASKCRAQHLTKILEYASKKVKYYKGLDSDIFSFPVLDKAIIRSNMNMLISKDYSVDILKKVVTSGSTGIPFQIFQNQNKVLRNTADAIAFGKMAGYRIGDPLGYFKIWTKVNRKSKFKQFAENIIPIDVTDLSQGSLQYLIKKMRQKKTPISYLGYPSALLELAKYIEHNDNSAYKANCIITMSEALEERARKKLAKAYNCDKVFSRYSNVENGIIAQQYSMDNSCFLVNTASYFVEILNDHNKPVEIGEIGKIVVTDYFNYGMPMIRYDTGDIGSLKLVNIDGVDCLVFSHVEGRKMDLIYDATGNLLSSFVVTNNMWDYPELLQYQFVQTGQASYKFKLNAPSGFNREKELLDHFKSILGYQADLNIEYVNEIPLLSSGKRKKVVNEMIEK